MKKVISILIILVLVNCLLLPVSADNAHLRIIDEAGLLTPSQLHTLSEKAEQVSTDHGTDIRIVTVQSIGSSSSQRYADHYFDSNNMGYGDDRSGILLLISMEDRDWAVTTNGEANKLVSYNDIGNIMDSIMDNLSGGNYYEAFDAYLDRVDRQFQLGVTGLSIPVRILIALASGLLVALIVLLILRSRMKTAQPQHGARSYIVDSSYDLFRCHDIYLYSHTSRVRKQQSSGGSSGGSRGGRSGKF